jgi:hypothetical protein
MTASRDLSDTTSQQGSEPCKGVSGAVNTPAGRSKVGEHAGLGGSRLATMDSLDLNTVLDNSQFWVDQGPS